MGVKEAIILAGGLGTRLRDRVPGLPKCMAPIAGKPFLRFLLDYFQNQGIESFIFSLGHKHEIIEEYLRSQRPVTCYQLSVEHEALGTGGAIRLACRLAENETVLIINGDTLFKIDCAQLSDIHNRRHADCTICLKPMNDFDRYGMVELDENRSVTGFHEKKFYKKGFINGGIYALSVNRFLGEDLPEKFSFEKDYLEKFYSTRKFLGFVQDKYFIDIGIPEDYERAQKEIANK